MNRLIHRSQGILKGRSFSTGGRLWKNNVIGVVRESYGIWERRAPLTPSHVTTLVNGGFDVHVQPSSRRVFADSEYAQAGATVKEDLSDCGLILGVKQVPVPNLLPDRAYMFFSHTIKGQEENMALLDECLKRNVTLIDYECLTEYKNGVDTGHRLVAFGKYAGIAGFIESLQGFGQQLLADGYSTPFLSSPQCFMHDSLDDAKQFLGELGEQIKTKGLPDGLGPLTFAFTGGGNVAQGALSMFELLPHRFVTPEELKDIVENPNPEEAKHCLYGVKLEAHDLVRRVSDHGFEFDDYIKNPHKYEPIFHEKIAPYTSMIVNGMYWDRMYPRLLTKDQLVGLAQQSPSNRPHLRFVADITCDVGGSVEFLTHSTTFDHPYFEWDVFNRCESEKVGAAEVGVGLLGVDILPTALPRESSKHFGDHLLPLLTQKDGEMHELNGACITRDGELTKPFKYIEKYRSIHARKYRVQDTEESESLAIRGHLFDSRFINDVFDMVEHKGGHFEVVEIHVIPNSNDGDRKESQVILKVSADTKELLEEISDEVQRRAAENRSAAATVEVLPYTRHTPTEQAKTPAPIVDTEGAKHVVLLGAGLVSPPFVEFLTRSGRTGDRKRRVTVVSHLADEAMRVAEFGNGLATPRVMSVAGDDTAELDGLIEEADLVVSLLPPPLHPQIAEKCVKFGTNMVTASYVSDQMRALDAAAREKGVILFNEMGLDPGMDHMSAMKVIDEAKAKGAKVTSFSSFCGGLTSPDALEPDDPFKYKFSWSPAGVFAAAMTTARYLWNGEIVTQDGPTKLNAARPFEGFKAFNLESIPNRDSLIYADLYNIPEAQTVIRGTLRFGGWCSLVHSMEKLGLLDASAAPLPVDSKLTWGQVLLTRAKAEGYDSVELYLSDKVGSEKAQDLLKALTWLGIKQDTPVYQSGATKPLRPLDHLVAVMSKRLNLNPGEKDLVIMQHDFGFSWPDGKTTSHTSSLISFGEPETSAMAKTVGVTAAIAADMVLEGLLDHRPGVVTPMTPDVYEPGLQRLADEGYVFHETEHN